jgi:5'-3' exonuclease
MPPQFAELAQGVLQDFFPDDFDIDLNGRTLPWEAAILIPFADEELFVQAEQQLFDQGMQLNKEEWQRNTTSFTYPSYFFDANLAKNRDRQTAKVLKSTLRHMDNYKHDFTQMTFHDDYEKCGQFSFISKLLPGVRYPQPDYPSLNWLDVTELHSTEKYINKVAFK